MMTRQKFEALVQNLERSAADRMGLYRFKVAILAAAGYVYIFVVLAVLVGMLILLVGALQGGRATYAIGKLGFILGALAITVLRSLWVRWPKPAGFPVKPDDAPLLFEEVEAIRNKLRAPKVHRIFLDNSYNAAMEQRPRLGVLGWPQGQMHIGLPLMHALSPAEFRAVLAHELGHLSGNHGRMTGWIYRIRETWTRLLQRLESEARWGSGVFTKFFGWYAPFLNAYSFVLARGQEFQADKCAAEIAGPETAAHALVAVDVRGKFLEEHFWPQFWKMANDSGEPPADPYMQQGTALKQSFPAAKANRWIVQSLAVKTGYVDTHPSLRDRLNALGVQVPVADWVKKVETFPKQSAAEVFLGESLESWYRQLHADWLSAAKSHWVARHAEAQEHRKRLAELQEQGKRAPLSEGEAWEQVRLTADLEGDQAAIPLLRGILQMNSHHVSANFDLGRILLAQRDASGLDHLNTAMQGDVQCTFSASLFAEQFLREQGRSEEADRCHKRAVEFAELREEADRERSNVTVSDEFREHALDAETVRAIKDHLKAYSHLKSAVLVRKQVKYFPEEPAYVLGLVPAGSWFRSSSDADTQLINSVAQKAPVPAGTYIVLLNSANSRLRKRMESVSGASVL
jgi:Zn-dependent protease with chaperone function